MAGGCAGHCQGFSSWLDAIRFDRFVAGGPSRWAEAMYLLCLLDATLDRPNAKRSKFQVAKVFLNANEMSSTTQATCTRARVPMSNPNDAYDRLASADGPISPRRTAEQPNSRRRSKCKQAKQEFPNRTSCFVIKKDTASCTSTTYDDAPSTTPESFPPTGIGLS